MSEAASNNPWGLIATAVNQIGKMYSSNRETQRQGQLEMYRNSQLPNMRYAQPIEQPRHTTGPGKTAGDISNAIAQGMGVIGGDAIRNQILKPALQGEEALMNPAQSPVSAGYAVYSGPYNSQDMRMLYRTRRS